MDYEDIVINSLVNGIKEAIRIFWNIKEVREYGISSIVGFFVGIISYRIVGKIMEYSRSYDIWVGREKGKLMYLGISTILGFLAGFTTKILVG